MGGGPSHEDGPAALVPIQFNFDGLPRMQDQFGKLLSQTSASPPRVSDVALLNRCDVMSKLLRDVRSDILLSFADWTTFFGGSKKHAERHAIIGQLFALLTGVVCLPEPPTSPDALGSDWCNMLESKYNASNLVMQRGSGCIEALGEISVSLCSSAQGDRTFAEKLQSTMDSFLVFLSEQPDKMVDVLVYDIEENSPEYDAIRAAMHKRTDLVVAATLLQESGWAFVSQKVNGICRAPSLVRPVGFPDPKTTTKASAEEQRKLESLIEQGPDLFWEVHGTPSHDDMGTWVTHNSTRYWCKVQLPVSVYYVGPTS